MNLCRPALVALLGVSTGCASNLSTLQSAVPIEPGHFRVQTGAGAYLPLGQTANAVDLGQSVIRRIEVLTQGGDPYELTTLDAQDLFAAGTSLAMFPPSIGWEFSGRTGVVKNVDVGLKYSVNQIKGDVKWRFLHESDPETVPKYSRRSVDVAVGLGFSSFIMSNPVLDALELVQVDDFSRWDLEVPLYVSQEVGGLFKLYASPKYIYSQTRIDQKLADFADQAGTVTGVDVQFPNLVRSHFVGVTGGFAVGLRWIHLYLELTAGNVFCTIDVLGSEREIGGLTVYPAAGLGVEF